MLKNVSFSWNQSRLFFSRQSKAIKIYPAPQQWSLEWLRCEGPAVPGGAAADAPGGGGGLRPPQVPHVRPGAEEPVQTRHDWTPGIVLISRLLLLNNTVPMSKIK